MERDPLEELATQARMRVATVDVLNTAPDLALASTALAALHALPACVLQQPGGPREVVLADPALRPRVAALIGPMFRPWLATEATVRALVARHFPASTSSPAPTAATSSPAPTAATSSPAPAFVLTPEPPSTTPAPRPAPVVAPEQQAAMLEAPRAKSRALDGAALAAALAEKVDLSDDEKRRILELDGKIDHVAPAELLGLARGTDAETVKERYYELSRAFHPDAHFRKKLGTYKARINRVFRGLKKACDALVDEAARLDHLDLGAATPAGPAQAPLNAKLITSTALTMPQSSSPAPPPKPRVEMQPERRENVQAAPQLHSREAAREMELDDKSSGLELDLSSRGGVSTFHLGAVGGAGGNATGVKPTALPPREAPAPSALADASVVAPGSAAPFLMGPSPSPTAPAQPNDEARTPETGEARPRLTSAARPAAGATERLRRPVSAAQRRRIALFAAAGGAIFLVVVFAVVSLSLRDKKAEVDPFAKAMALYDDALTANKAGNYAEAIVYASGVIETAPATPLAASAHALRGRAELELGDREGAGHDLEEALHTLPPEDGSRPSLEAALAKARQ